MATEIIERSCDTCSHATTCSFRETFLKIQANKKDMMIYMGAKNVSNTIRVRVEHRYVDGPGLKELVKKMGLDFWGKFPCSSYTGLVCPMLGRWSHAFDAPIFAPHPHAVGYIRPLCRGGRDMHGERIPFIPPPAPARTNEYHAAPWNTEPAYAKENWWTCKSCHRRPTCDRFNDIAQIGSSIYSIFAVSHVEGKPGDIIDPTSIAVPEACMPDYDRYINTDETDGNPYFTLEDEEQVLIMYYKYNPPGKPTPPDDAEEPDEPPMKPVDPQPEPDVPETYKVTVFAGTESDNMTAFCYPMDRVSDFYEDPPKITIYRRTTVSTPNMQQGLTVVTNKSLMDTLISDRPWVSFTAREDVSEFFHIRAPGCWEPDVKMMRFLCPTANIDLASFSMRPKDEDGVPYMDYILTFEAKENCNLFICFKHNGIEVPGPSVNILEHWPRRATWLNLDCNWTGRVYSPSGFGILPKMYINEEFLDPRYTYSNYLPSCAQIYFNCYKLLRGWTFEAHKRKTFDPTINVYSPHAPVFGPGGGMVEFNLRYGFTLNDDLRPNVTPVYAMYQMCLDNAITDFIATFKQAFENVEICDDGEGIKISLIRTKKDADTDAKTIDINDLSEDRNSVNSEGVCYGVNHEPPAYLKLTLNYDPENVDKIIEALHNCGDIFGDDFIMSPLYLIPPASTYNHVSFTASYFEETYDAKPRGFIHTYTKLVDEVNLNTAMSELVTPISNYKLEDEDGMKTVRDSLNFRIICVVSARQSYGLSAKDQNFFIVALDVYQNPIEVSATIVKDGKEMASCFPFSNIKAITLSGLYPEDVGKVNTVINTAPCPSADSVITLDGPRAKFYKVSPFCSIAYQQRILVDCSYYGRAIDPEHTSLMVNTYDNTTIDLSVPERTRIVDIAVMQIGVDKDYTTLMELVDGAIVTYPLTFDNGMEITFNHLTGEKTELDEPIVHIEIKKICSDIKFNVRYFPEEYAHICPKDECQRCKDYEHIEKFPQIDWTPECKLYEKA